MTTQPDPPRLTFTHNGTRHLFGMPVLTVAGTVDILVYCDTAHAIALTGTPTADGITLRTDHWAVGELEELAATAQPHLLDVARVRRHLDSYRHQVHHVPQLALLIHAYSSPDRSTRAATTALLAQGFTGTTAELDAIVTAATSAPAT